MGTRWRAPGRINLIGEHTDYNEGFALPLAIAQGCTASVAPRSDGSVVVRSAQRDDAIELPAGELYPGDGGWAGYVLGAIWVLQQAGLPAGPATIEIDSDVPIGSGLSSSAAVVCSVTRAMLDLLDAEPGDAELLAMTRRVENDFVGAPTGGMDQLVSLRAEADHALLCDMRSLASEPLPLPLAEQALRLLVVDTRAEHRHSDGEYRQRREGCERAAAELGVRALRDITSDGLAAALDRLDDEELRRYVRHIVTEDDRVLRVAALLREGRLAHIGPLLTESHASMRDDYRISIDELDVAVDTTLEAGAFGARMTGGGFGGCAIALLREEDVEPAAQAVLDAFGRRGFHEPSWFAVDRAAPGAHRVESDAEQPAGPPG